MREIAFWTLVGILVLGTLGIMQGTRSMSDIKGPVYTVGAIAIALIAVWDFGGGVSITVPAGLGRFALVSALYVAFLGLSALWAPHKWVVKHVVVDQGVYVLIALAAALVAADMRRWRTLLKAYLVLGAAAITFSFTWHTLVPYFAAYPGSRGEAIQNLLLNGWVITGLGGVRSLSTLNDVRAPFGNANLLAAFLLIPLGLSGAFLWREITGRLRPWVIAGLGILLIAGLVLFAYCRAVSYAMGLGVLATVFAVLRLGWRRLPHIAAGWAALGLVGLGGIAAAGKLGWVETQANHFVNSKSYIVRAELWRRAAVMTKEKPILGWGAGNYFTDSTPIAAQTATREMTFWEGGAPHKELLCRIPASADSNAHNEYLQQSTQGGMAGLTIYLLMIIAAAASAAEARRRGFEETVLLDGVIAIFAALLFTIIMNPEIHFADFAPHFWVIMGLLVAAGGTAGSRKVRLPQPLGAAAAVALTVAGCYGIYQFAALDYVSSRKYWEAYGKRTVEEAPKAAAIYMESADLTWDQVLRIRALYGAGDCYERAGRIDKAIGAFGTLSREITTLYNTDYRLGTLYERAGDYEKALYHYRLNMMGHPEDDKQTKARVEAVEALIKLKAEAPGLKLPAAWGAGRGASR